MEASEERLFHDNEGVVRALEDRLVIERLEIADERTARVVRERAEAGESPADTVTQAIEIGTRVLASEGTAANVGYVDEALKRVSVEVQKGFIERAQQTLDALQKRLDGKVGEGTEAVTKAFAEGKQDLLRQLSTETLADFKNSMTRTMTEVGQRQERESKSLREQVAKLSEQLVSLRERDEADRRVAEEVDRGTAKGFSFEERVDAAIERIAAARGDVATHTGTEAAEGGGKKGDTLVELGAADGPSAGRLLFEAKDKKLSKNEAWQELNDGMAARAAAFAVLVVAGGDRVPSGREPLVEYQGNKLIVPVDREEPDGIELEVAYKLAVARVRMARDAELTVDAVAVRDTAAEAISLLKQAQAIRSTLTGIKTSSDKARAGLDGLVEAVRAKLERIDSLVAED